MFPEGNALRGLFLVRQCAVQPDHRVKILGITSEPFAKLVFLLAVLFTLLVSLGHPLIHIGFVRIKLFFADEFPDRIVLVIALSVN